MARTLSCDYHFDLPNFEKVSDNAKDFISKLLLLNAEVRVQSSSVVIVMIYISGEIHC